MRIEPETSFILKLGLTNKAVADSERLVPNIKTAVKELESENDFARVRVLVWLNGLLSHQEGYIVYLRNNGRNREEQQAIELRIATDAAHPPNKTLQQTLHGKSLRLIGAESYDRHSDRRTYTVYGLDLIEGITGSRPPNSEVGRVFFEVERRLPQSIYTTYETGLPDSLLAKLSALPTPDAERLTIKKRLEDWRGFLDVQERSAKDRQFSVSILRSRRGQSTKFLTLVLDLPSNDPEWQKVISTGQDNLYIAEVDPTRRLSAASLNDDDRDFGRRDWQIGTLAEAKPGQGEVRILLDEEVARRFEEGTLKLPPNAALVYKADGELSQIKRLKYGLESLRNGRAANPRLSSFLFKASDANRPDTDKPIRLSPDQLLQERLNTKQREAVEGVLNAPDLFLIQGPPGTGKTTVIAEICYQNTLRGQRTLIASQSNLAVDNALSRLVHHSSIRALRRGRAERVEDEGKPFLEDNVIGTWLKNTADSCEQDFQKRKTVSDLWKTLVTGNQPRINALRHQANQCAAEELQLKTQAADMNDRYGQSVRDLADLNEKLSHLAGAHQALAVVHKHASENAVAPLQDLLASGDLTKSLENSFSFESISGLLASVQRLGEHLMRWDETGVKKSSVDISHPPLAIISLATQRLNEYNTITTRMRQCFADLDALQTQARAWYALAHQLEPLVAERGTLRSRVSKIVEQRRLTQAQQQLLTNQHSELEKLHETLKESQPLITAWLQVFLETPNLNPSKGPAGIGSPMLAAVWPGVVKIAGFRRFVRQLETARRSRNFQQRLLALTKRFEVVARVLRKETEAGGLSNARSQSADWQTSPLAACFYKQADGSLTLGPETENKLSALEKSLIQLKKRPAWWARLFGAERRRQTQLAAWVVWLESASAAWIHDSKALGEASDAVFIQVREAFTATSSSLHAASLKMSDELAKQAYKDLQSLNDPLQQLGTGLQADEQALANIEQQIASNSRARAAFSSQLANVQFAYGHLAPVRRLLTLFNEVGQVPEPVWESRFQDAYEQVQNRFATLESLAASIQPLAIVDQANEELEQKATRLQAKLNKLTAETDWLAKNIADTEQRYDMLYRQLEKDHAWWPTLVNGLSGTVAIPLPETTPYDPRYIINVLTNLDTWGRPIKQESSYLDQCAPLVTDWVKRLRSSEPRDYGDLRRIYVDNANVIGTTCVQAGSQRFSEEYRDFDCVIIDEVSKATPPELLLPMLKGAKIVLVGDHKQLPPMVGSDTLTDLAADLNAPLEDLQHLERSLFKELFEQCPPELRVMLTTQYRMHPQIMDGINQFYEQQLVCGIDNPDSARSHGMVTRRFGAQNHIAWITTPVNPKFHEARLGTSYRNLAEINIIESVVSELDLAWQPQVAQGADRKEIGVITFYGAQVSELKERLLNRTPEKEFKNLRIRVGTVDRFQGMESPIIIVSLVRNNSQGDVGFARKPERVNVALSRAQELLVVVGSRDMFCARVRNPLTAGIYNNLAEVVGRSHGFVNP